MRETKLKQALETASAMWLGEPYRGNIIVTQVKRAGNGIIARTTVPNAPGALLDAVAQDVHFHEAVLAYYPKMEHAEKFAASQTGDVGGPRYYHPGCVGELRMKKRLEGGIEILIQGVKEDAKVGLTKQVISQYRRWRSHLLREAFRIAEEKGFKEIHLLLHPLAGKLNKPIFLGVAKKRGWQPTAEEVTEGIKWVSVRKVGNGVRRPKQV